MMTKKVSWAVNLVSTTLEEAETVGDRESVHTIWTSFLIKYRLNKFLNKPKKP